MTKQTNDRKMTPAEWEAWQTVAQVGTYNGKNSVDTADALVALNIADGDGPEILEQANRAMYWIWEVDTAIRQAGDLALFFGESDGLFILVKMDGSRRVLLGTYHGKFGDLACARWETLHKTTTEKTPKKCLQDLADGLGLDQLDRLVGRTL